MINILDTLCYTGTVTVCCIYPVDFHEMYLVYVHFRTFLCATELLKLTREGTASLLSANPFTTQLLKLCC